jgi:hypothetical protein
MQRPTCLNMRVRTTQDAQVIFHAVHLKILPIITRRLDNEERREIRSGCVYVWEERSPNTEAIGMVGVYGQWIPCPCSLTRDYLGGDRTVDRLAELGSKSC